MNEPETQVNNLVLDLAEWEKTRLDLWKGRPQIEIDGVIKTSELLGIRQLITMKWNTLGLESSLSHWSILELGRLERTLSDEFINRMSILGITREKNPIFDVYCRHLEGGPEQKIQESLAIHTSPAGVHGNSIHQLKKVAFLVWEILCALVVPQARK